MVTTDQSLMNSNGYNDHFENSDLNKIPKTLLEIFEPNQGDINNNNNTGLYTKDYSISDNKNNSTSILFCNDYAIQQIYSSQSRNPDDFLFNTVKSSDEDPFQWPSNTIANAIQKNNPNSGNKQKHQIKENDKQEEEKNTGNKLMSSLTNSIKQWTISKSHQLSSLKINDTLSLSKDVGHIDWKSLKFCCTQTKGQKTCPTCSSSSKIAPEIAETINVDSIRSGQHFLQKEKENTTIPILKNNDHTVPMTTRVAESSLMCFDEEGLYFDSCQKGLEKAVDNNENNNNNNNNNCTDKINKKDNIINNDNTVEAKKINKQQHLSYEKNCQISRSTSIDSHLKDYKFPLSKIQKEKQTCLYGNEKNSKPDHIQSILQDSTYKRFKFGESSFSLSMPLNYQKGQNDQDSFISSLQSDELIESSQTYRYGHKHDDVEDKAIKCKQTRFDKNNNRNIRAGPCEAGGVGFSTVYKLGLNKKKTLHSAGATDNKAFENIAHQTDYSICPNIVQNCQKQNYSCITAGHNSNCQDIKNNFIHGSCCQNSEPECIGLLVLSPSLHDFKHTKTSRDPMGVCIRTRSWEQNMDKTNDTFINQNKRNEKKLDCITFEEVYQEDYYVWQTELKNSVENLSSITKEIEEKIARLSTPQFYSGAISQIFSHTLSKDFTDSIKNAAAAVFVEQEEEEDLMRNLKNKDLSKFNAEYNLKFFFENDKYYLLNCFMRGFSEQLANAVKTVDDDDNQNKLERHDYINDDNHCSTTDKNSNIPSTLPLMRNMPPSPKNKMVPYSVTSVVFESIMGKDGISNNKPYPNHDVAKQFVNPNENLQHDNDNGKSTEANPIRMVSSCTSLSSASSDGFYFPPRNQFNKFEHSSSSSSSSCGSSAMMQDVKLLEEIKASYDFDNNPSPNFCNYKKIKSSSSSSSSLLPLKDFENGVHQLGTAANVHSEKFNVCQEQLCREEELELTKSVFPYQKEEKNDINEHHIKTYTGKNVYHQYNNKSSIQIITINKNEHQTSYALDGNTDQYFDTDNSSDNVAFKLASELCQRGPSTTTSIQDFYMSKEESEEDEEEEEKEGNSTITRITSPKILNKISRDSAFLYKNNNGSNKTGFKEELVQRTFDTKVQEKLNIDNFGQIRHSPVLSVEPFFSVLMQSVQSSKTQPQSSKPDKSSSIRLSSEIKINIDHPENTQFIFSKNDGDDDRLNHLLYKDILETNSTTNTLSKDTTTPLPRSPFILDPDQTVGDHLTKCRLSRRNSKFVTQSDLQTLKEKKQNNTPVQNSKIGGRKDIIISNSELCPNSNYIDIDEKDVTSSKCQLKLCLNANPTAESNEMGPALCNNNITSNNIKLIPEKPKKSWKCKPDFYGGNESSSSLLTAIVVSNRAHNNNNMAAAAKNQNYGNLDMTSRTGYKANMIITKNNYIGTTSHSSSISTKQALIEGGPNQSNDNKLNNDKDRLFKNEQTLLEINESFFSDGMSKILPKGQFQIGHKNDACNPIKQDGDYLGNGKMCQNEKKKKNLQKEKKNNKNLIIDQSYDNSSSDSDNKSSSKINDFESRDLSSDSSYCSNPLHLCENAAFDYCKDSAAKIDKSCLIYGFRNELKDTVGPSSEILKTSDLDTEKQAFAQLFANVDDIDNDDQSQRESNYYCYYNNNGNNNSKKGLLPFDSVDDDLSMHPSSQNKDKLKNLQFFRKCSSSSTPCGNAQNRFRHSSFRTIPKPVVKELNHSTLDLPNLNSLTSKKELINNNNNNSNSNNQQKFSDPLLQFLSESKSLFQSDYEAFLDSTTQQCKNDKARFSKKNKKVKSCAAVGHVPDASGLFRLNKEGFISSSSSSKKNHLQSLRRKSSHSDGRLHEQMRPKNDCHQLSLNSGQQIPPLASSFHNHGLYDDENNNSDNFHYKSNLETADLLTPPHSSIVSTPCSYLELDSGSEAGFDNNGADWYCDATNVDDEDNYSDEIDETALTQAFLSNLGSFSTRARNSCANEQTNHLSISANLGNKIADRHKYNVSSISSLYSSDSSSTDLYLSNIRSVELCDEDDKIQDLIKGIDDIKHKFEYGETEDNEHKQVSNARDNAIIFRQHSNDACHLPSIQTVNFFVNGTSAADDVESYGYTKLGTKQDARYIASLKHGYFSNRSFSAVAVQCCASDCSSNADDTQHSFQERIFSGTAESNASPCNSEGFPFIALSVEQSSSSSSSLLPLPILESAEFAQARLDEIQTQAHVPETSLNDATSTTASAAVVEADAMFMKNCSADSQAQLSTMVASSSISHNFENNNNFSGQTSSLNTTLISSSQCIAPENLDEQSSTNNKSREDPCYTFRSNFFKYQTTDDDWHSASGCCKCQSSHSLQKHAHGLGYHYTHNTTNTLKRTFSNAFNNTFTHDTEDFATQFNFIGNNNLIIFPVKLNQNNIPIKKSNTQDDNNNNSNNNTSQEFSFDDAFQTQPESTNNRYNDIVTTEEKQDNHDEEYLKTADTNYSNISFPTFDFSNEGEEGDCYSSSHFKNFCKDDGYDTDEQEDPSVDFYYRNKKLVLLDNIDKRLLKYPNDSDRTVKVPAREVQSEHVASTDFIPSLEQCLIYSDNETPTNATEDACSFDSQMIFPMSLEEPEPEPSIPVPNNTFSSQHFSELPTVPAESNIKYDQLINELDHVIEKISKLTAKLDLTIGSTSSRDDAQTHSQNLKSKCLANAFVHTYRQIEHEKN